MSTLKTHNLQSPDASSVNIALAPNAGMVVTGISTFNDDVKLPDDKSYFSVIRRIYRYIMMEAIAFLMIVKEVY